MDEIREQLKQDWHRGTVDARIARLSVAAVTATAEHREAELNLTHAKGHLYGDGKTDQERKINMDYAVRDLRKKADDWGDLVMLIQQQIEIGKILLTT